MLATSLSQAHQAKCIVPYVTIISWNDCTAPPVHEIKKLRSWVLFVSTSDHRQLCSYSVSDIPDLGIRLVVPCCRYPAKVRKPCSGQGWNATPLILVIYLQIYNGNMSRILIYSLHANIQYSLSSESSVKPKQDWAILRVVSLCHHLEIHATKTFVY